ncbi:MAG: glycosyltransferase family 4 protein [Leptolyngbyaceae cyanobacterium SU_3_3]|nr:glycosyltransferase family 4 protein [Leptolyngbyaceae cyanobacterium SU_3_3]NJR50089.1 glycosyltransferase family 4 protein [Leptolyngbyaceae cyanobacterium CSU_1_3]
MTIAYLVNMYPKVSHSFIRREIAALEELGLSIARFSIRSGVAQVVDPADKFELQNTRVVLDVGVLGLLKHLVTIAFIHPLGLLKAVWLTFKLSQRSTRGLFIHLIYVAEACVLVNWFHAAGVSHIHAHFGTNSTTVAMLCHAIAEISYSFTVHGPEEFDFPETLSLTEKISRADFVVAISSFGKSQLYRWCDYSQWAKIHVVRCGLEADFLQQPFVAIADTPNLVCVGRLCEQKGQLLLIEAMRQLAIADIPCQLTLVGDGALRPKIEALIHQYHLESRVKITGWASSAEVQTAITEARSLVLPSFAEGLPVVIMESLALGRPVISTYIAGIPELVETGVNGWLVPSGSVEALIAAMQTVLQTPLSSLEQMGQLGAKQVFQQHNARAEAYKLAALFAKK